MTHDSLTVGFEEGVGDGDRRRLGSARKDSMLRRAHDLKPGWITRDMEAVADRRRGAHCTAFGTAKARVRWPHGATRSPVIVHDQPPGSALCLRQLGRKLYSLRPAGTSPRLTFTFLRDVVQRFVQVLTPVLLRAHDLDAAARSDRPRNGLRLRLEAPARSCPERGSVDHDRQEPDKENTKEFGHGIDTQLQSVTVKTHASSGAQNPSHDGESASPHGVFRHSHAPPEATAEQWPPSPHVPSHFRSLLLKSHGPGGDGGRGRGGADRRWAARRRCTQSCARLKSTTRWPPSSSVICAADGTVGGKRAGSRGSRRPGQAMASSPGGVGATAETCVARQPSLAGTVTRHG